MSTKWTIFCQMWSQYKELATYEHSFWAFGVIDWLASEAKVVPPASTQKLKIQHNVNVRPKGI